MALPRIEVAPVRLEFGNEKAIGSLRLHNTSDAPVAFEAQALAWTQSEGEDILTETNAAIVSPPAFVIAPHGEQIVRVGVHVSDRDKEQTFRLLFTENLLNTTSEDQNLRLRLQMSLPVFVAPRGGQTNDVLRVEHADAGEKVRISNVSNRHVVIADSFVGATKVPLPRYLLAGQSVERAVPTDAAPISLALQEGASIVKKEYRIAPEQNRGLGWR